MRYAPLADNPLANRADLQRAMRDLFEPLLPWFSEGCARVRIGSTGVHYTSSSAELETFSRPLWGLVPLAMGGGSFAHWDLYQRGVANGTDPRHPEFWRHDANQRFVEMAALSLGICQLPGIFWNPFPPEVRENIAAWLGTVNQCEFPVCNWLFFRILVNVAMRAVGAPFDASRLEADLVDIERQYLRDGWYSDALNGNRDYYVSFALHYYGLVYARIAGKADPARAERFRERAALFAKDFIYWFSPDGSAIPYGRSQTYRFAQAGFWSALEFAKVDILPPGVLKGLVLRHLRWWFQRPIFTETGLLTIGYGYPNMFMAENYNAPGSPYWALKTFLVLALPESDPFWSEAEEPLPELDAVSEQVEPGMMIYRHKGSANVVALRAGQNPPGHRHSPEKYCKFAYSTGFAFNVPTEPDNLSCRGHDNMLALSEDGIRWRVRGVTTDCRIGHGVIFSKWSPWPDVQITTWLVPHGAWHLRIHRVNTLRSLETAEGGFAIGYSDEAKGNARKGWISDSGVAVIPAGGALSGIRELLGGRTGENVVADPNSNLLVPDTAIPTLRGLLTPGEHWLGAAVLGYTGADGMQQWETGKSWSGSAEKIATYLAQQHSREDASTLINLMSGSRK